MCANKIEKVAGETATNLGATLKDIEKLKMENSQ